MLSHPPIQVLTNTPDNATRAAETPKRSSLAATTNTENSAGPPLTLPVTPSPKTLASAHQSAVGMTLQSAPTAARGATVVTGLARGNATKETVAVSGIPRDTRLSPQSTATGRSPALTVRSNLFLLAGIVLRAVLHTAPLILTSGAVADIRGRTGGSAVTSADGPETVT